MFLYERPPWGKMLVGVGKSDIRVVEVRLCFVHAPDSPLARVFQFASNALTAWELNGEVQVAVSLVKDSIVVPVFVLLPAFPSVQRMIAGHLSQSDAATHRSGDVTGFNTCACSKVSTRLAT